MSYLRGDMRNYYLSHVQCDHCCSPSQVLITEAYLISSVFNSTTVLSMEYNYPYLTYLLITNLKISSSILVVLLLVLPLFSFALDTLAVQMYHLYLVARCPVS